MALFKPFRGSRESLDMQELHDGYAYFCTDDGSFHIDYTDADGNLQRKQVNEQDLIQIQDALDALPVGAGAGDYAVVQDAQEGDENSALGRGSGAFGANSKADADYAFALGSWAAARAQAAFAANAGDAKEIFSAAFGDSYAEADRAFAKGFETHAKAYASETGGIETIVEEDAIAGVADGKGSVAGAPYSTAHNLNCKTGKDAKAAYAGGDKSEANHAGAFVHGLDLRTGRNYQAVVGQLNAIDSEALFVVGSGDNAERRKNAFKVTEAGIETGSIKGSAINAGNVTSNTIKNSGSLTTDSVTARAVKADSIVTTSGCPNIYENTIYAANQDGTGTVFTNTLTARKWNWNGGGWLNASLTYDDISKLPRLDSNGRIPSSQLPSYVDDVLEFADMQSFPGEGESGKIYIDMTTNKTYRWSGTVYVEISASLALGCTSSTAYPGDKGQEVYDLASSLRSDVVGNQQILTSHVNNESIHIAEEDREKWNDAAVLTSGIGENSFVQVAPKEVANFANGKLSGATGSSTFAGVPVAALSNLADATVSILWCPEEGSYTELYDGVEYTTYKKGAIAIRSGINDPFYIHRFRLSVLRNEDGTSAFVPANDAESAKQNDATQITMRGYPIFDAIYDINGGDEYEDLWIIPDVEISLSTSAWPQLTNVETATYDNYWYNLITLNLSINKHPDETTLYYITNDSKNTVSSVTGADASGNKTMAGATGASARGNENLALAPYSDVCGSINLVGPGATFGVASGVRNKVYAMAGSAEGGENVLEVTAERGHIEGSEGVGRGRGCHVEGTGNIVDTDADAGHAEGNQTKTTARYAHSQNSFTIAGGVSSHAGGEHTETKHTGAFTHGLNLTSGRNYQAVFGQNSVEDADAYLVVGVGPTIANRKNQLVVHEDRVKVADALYASSAEFTDSVVTNNLTANGLISLSSGAITSTPSWVTVNKGSSFKGEAWLDAGATVSTKFTVKSNSQFDGRAYFSSGFGTSGDIDIVNGAWLTKGAIWSTRGADGTNNEGAIRTNTLYLRNKSNQDTSLTYADVEALKVLQAFKDELIITFTVNDSDGTKYTNQTARGVTWREFVQKTGDPYSVLMDIDGSTEVVKYGSSGKYIMREGRTVPADDVILPSGAYYASV